MQDRSSNQSQSSLAQGLALHKQGLWAAAERCYEGVLEQIPNDFDALHLLGVIAGQTQRHERAVQLISMALRQKNVAAAHAHLAKSLFGLGRKEEAVDSYGRAIAMQPEFVEGYINRAAALRDLKRPQEALAGVDRAIALRPDAVAAHVTRAAVLRDLKRLDEALAAVDRAIQLQPGVADAHISRAAILKDLHRLQEALSSAERAIELRPDSPEAHYNCGDVLRVLARPVEALARLDCSIALHCASARAHSARGSVLLDLQRFDEALASCDTAIALDPEFAQAHSNRGAALRELGRPAEALASCDRALELCPEFAGAYVNQGSALQDLQRPEVAVSSYEMAMRLQPRDAAASTYRGTALYDLQQPGEALRSYSRAIDLDPSSAEAHWSAGLCYLQMGDFETGWELYEWRKRLSRQIGVRALPQAEWTGEQELQGKSIYIHAEQGLGDTLQFCRYALLVRALGARVVLAVQRPLCELVRTLGESIEVIGEEQAAPATDYHVALMSLPRAFATRMGSIPACVPYLSADPERVQRWRERLGRDGLKIGVCWQGSTARIDIGRSLALSHFAPVSAIPGVRLISLQKSHGVEQLGALPPAMRVETLGPEFDAGADAFVDSAAVMQSLDLIVTSDTSIAHLAGALGRATWIALKHAPDWRWLLQRQDSPWYPTMRLYRQPQRGDWPAVFDCIRRDIDSMLSMSKT
jgi:tetratricopeptide (TPR) repeat protein